MNPTHCRSRSAMATAFPGHVYAERFAMVVSCQRTAQGAQVCLLGIPPLEHFPAFPRPLADALGWRGRVFDAIGATAVQARERALRIQTAEPLGSEMFAGDGFHPSPTLHAAFADAVMAGLRLPKEQGSRPEYLE